MFTGLWDCIVGLLAACLGLIVLYLVLISSDLN